MCVCVVSLQCAPPSLQKSEQSLSALGHAHVVHNNTQFKKAYIESLRMPVVALFTVPCCGYLYSRAYVVTHISQLR